MLTKGPKGQISSPLPEGIELKQEGNVLNLLRQNKESELKAIHGTARMLLYNNIVGVSKGWSKNLELVGVGYRVQLKAKTLIFSLGYSHDINFPLPENVEVKITDQTKLNLNCIDKQKLGQIASQIRSLRPPEPYKGKGVRYVDERIIRKSGKSAKAAK